MLSQAVSAPQPPSRIINVRTHSWLPPYELPILKCGSSFFIVPFPAASAKAKMRDWQMHGCTHLSRFALVSRVFPGRYAKKYTGYCIIACVLTWLSTHILIE